MTRMSPLPSDIPSGAARDGEWAAHRSILAYGVRIGVRTNQARFLNRILDHAPPLWKFSSAPSVERQFSFRFAPRPSPKNRGSAHLLLDDFETATESTSFEEILETFEVRVKMHVAEMAPRRVFVHAAAVGWRGKAIIVPGQTMSGKTSLAAEFVRAGATYYSDEYAVLDMFGRVHPYPKALSIRRERSFKQEACPAEKIGGVTGTRPLPVGLVTVTGLKEGVSWRPAPLPPGPAALELLANAISARRKPEVVLTTLKRVVSNATCLKGLRGEAEETARLILERWRPEPGSK